MSFKSEDRGKARLFEICDDRSRLSGRWELIFAFLQIFMTRFVVQDNEIWIRPSKPAPPRYLASAVDGPTAAGGIVLCRRFKFRCSPSRCRGVVAYLPDLRSRSIRKAPDMGTQEDIASICLVATKSPKRERLLQRCYHIMLSFVCNSRDGSDNRPPCERARGLNVHPQLISRSYSSIRRKSPPVQQKLSDCCCAFLNRGSLVPVFGAA
jgi:hypothetical protein